MNKNDCEQIWMEVLSKDKIDSSKDFFENGGNSIKVLELAKIIQERFTIELDIMNFFNNAMIDNIMNQVNKLELPKTNENLVLLKKGTSEDKNLIFIHGGSGEIGAFIQMCNEINDTYNIYAISFDKNNMKIGPQMVEVEDLASLYLSYLKKENINIDVLVGWCIGGKIAFEMICQLNNPKIKLYLLNAVPPNQTRKGIENSEFSLDEEIKFLKKSLVPYKANREKINSTFELWEDLTRYMEEHRKVYKYLKFVSPKYIKLILHGNDDVELFVRYFNLVRSFEESHYRYTKDIEKKVEKIYYVNAKKQSVDNFNYWINYSNEYEEHNINTDHNGIVSEEVAKMIFKDLSEESFENENMVNIFNSNIYSEKIN